MIIYLKQGNILEYAADVLVTAANPWLSMSGGINADILSRCGMKIQDELNAYLDDCGLKAVSGATVVPTSASGLPFRHVIHAVAVDAFEDSSEALVSKTIIAALQLADAFTAESISLPPLATGYGPLSLRSFVNALGAAIVDRKYFVEQIQLVLETEDQVQETRAAFAENSWAETLDIR